MNGFIRDRNQITAEKIMAEPNASCGGLCAKSLNGNLCLSAPWFSMPIKTETVIRAVAGKTVGNDRHRVIHVVNGSLEPDGSRREFVLGAMSGARTAHEAVAMSYGINPQHYREVVRT